ncbi:MAG: hypothetical protein EON55_05545 [Alphaproteobacteria bacterium]|nr:MAG: hypothetical protein EON55_05545 [Alphaproteobacteria bacterium]
MMWLVAAFVFLLCFIAACTLSIRRDEAAALSAAQAASAILVLLIVVLAVWWQQLFLISIGLTAVLLAFPSALVIAGLLKRDGST